jgi:C-terminal processing protease CtpA/Prc
VVKGEAIHYGGKEIARLTTDSATSPKVIDLKFRGPDRKYEGVYSVEKEVLSICLNRRDDATERPGKLSTRDQPDWILLVFEKEKSAPEKPLDGLTGFVGVMLAFNDERKEVVVNAPIEGSPAEKAGVKKDDVILKVGAVKATDLDTTVKTVRDARPGTKLDLTILRDKKEMTITVTVGVLPFQYVVGLG